MVSAMKKWLGIDDIEAALKDVPSVAMLQVAELNQKKRHEEVLAAISALSLTTEPIASKIVAKTPAPKRVNWKQAQAALEKASEPQEEE